MAVQWIHVLLILIKVAVSTEVVKLVGSSVKLDIQKDVDIFEDFVWKFNISKVVVKYNNESKKVKDYLPYNDRADFNERTYSLTLKNLKKSDSGRYEARISGDTEGTVAEYTLSVLDPVETPVLTRVPDHQNSDTCNITLTCTGHDLSVSSNCFNETCEEKEMTSPEGITLSLSVRDSSSVICNISNSVSWSMSVMDMKDIKQWCYPEDPVSPPAGQSACLLKTLVYTALLSLMLSAVITVHIREKLLNRDLKRNEQIMEIF